MLFYKNNKLIGTSEPLDKPIRKNSLIGVDTNYIKSIHVGPKNTETIDISGRVNLNTVFDKVCLNAVQDKSKKIKITLKDIKKDSRGENKEPDRCGKTLSETKS